VPPTWIERLLDFAFGVAIGWLLAARRRLRSRAAGTPRGPTHPETVPAQTAGAESSASSRPETTHARCESPEQSWTEPLTNRSCEHEALSSLEPPLDEDVASHAASFSGGIEPHASSTVPLPDATSEDGTRRRGAGVVRLAPPPPLGSETPAHRVLRLGDAPESPIHSQSPDDWEDIPLPSGEVLLAPRGFQALADRTSTAFHLRKAFRRVK
jgi:hypothetical protein